MGKQSYLQGWDFEMKTYRETCAMFERMEIAEQMYKGKPPFKKVLGQMLNMKVMPGNEREDNPPHLPTLRRAATEIPRKQFSLYEQEYNHFI